MITSKRTTLRYIAWAVFILAAMVAGRSGMAGVLVPTHMECDRTEAMVKNLTQQYQVLLTEQGLSSNGELVQIWTDRHGKFSVIAVSPKGIACYLIGGTHWDKAVADAKGQDL
jgi:hypothetical protein